MPGLAQESLDNPAIAMLQDVVLDSGDVQQFLSRLAEVAAKVFSGTYGDVFCGVTLLRPRSMITVASSSEGVRQFDEVQYGFDDEGVAAAEAIAENASRSLRLAVRIGRLTDDARNLEAALSSRTTIDLAVGAIMAQNRCGQDETIAILRRASSARNIKLRDVAASVLASVGQSQPASTHFNR